MTIVCCGPESSGTRLLAQIVASSGMRVRHRSVPHDEVWDMWLAAGDRVVVIRRDEMCTMKSAMNAGHAPTMTIARMRLSAANLVIAEQIRVAEIPEADRYGVRYEALVDDPQTVVSGLASWVGADLMWPMVTDENRKWLDGPT